MGWRKDPPGRKHTSRPSFSSSSSLVAASMRNSRGREGGGEGEPSYQRGRKEGEGKEEEEGSLATKPGFRSLLSLSFLSSLF